VLAAPTLLQSASSLPETESLLLSSVRAGAAHIVPERGSLVLLASFLLRVLLDLRRIPGS